MYVSARGAGPWIAGAAVALLLSIPRANAATTYYVRASGNDSDDGLTPQTAFASIRHGGQLLLAPGDRVVVGPGTYAEGNIEPYGKGNRDAPIVFHGNASGELTGDPPGPVRVHPHMPEAPNGFLFFGERDVVIEGFTIEGAADTAIEVSPHYSTGVDSTRITVRNNTIAGGRRGIDIVAVGDVAVIDNKLVGDESSGIRFRSGKGGSIRPRVTGNQLAGYGFGIAAAGTEDATVTRNTVDGSGRALQFDRSQRTVVTDNEFIGPVEIDSNDLEFARNTLRRGTRFHLEGSAGFNENRFLNLDSKEYDLVIYAGAASAIALAHNELSGAYVSTDGTLELAQNSGLRLEAWADAITMIDNVLTGGATLHADSTARVAGNEALGLFVQGASIDAADNDLGFGAEIIGDDLAITRNRVGSSLLIQRRESAPDIAGIHLIEENVVGRDLWVAGDYAMMQTVRGNRVGGQLHLRAPMHLEVADNETSGVTCVSTKAEGIVSVVGNSVRDAQGAGMLLVAARAGVVMDNEISGSTGAGLVIRRAANVTVQHNVIRDNDGGGLSLDVGTTVAGDCNNDGAVTVDELIVAVEILQGNRRLRECMPLDVGGDQLGTIEELVAAVDAALGRESSPPAGDEVVVRENVIEDNRRYGVDIFTGGPVLVAGNRVLRNGGIGIAAQLAGTPREVKVSANIVGSNSGEGMLFIDTEGAAVRDNIVFSNGESGVLLRGARSTSVINNLIYANGNDGIGIGVGTRSPTPNAVLLNNTIYDNAQWAVTIGSTGVASAGTAVSNNIIDGNGLGGIAAERASITGLSIGFNLQNDLYDGHVDPSVTDFRADPRFVSPAGGDGIAGEGGFEDDDFHLLPESAAIDAGSTTAAQLGITGSAVSGVEADDGIVDVGFHYDADAYIGERCRSLGNLSMVR